MKRTNHRHENDVLEKVEHEMPIIGENERVDDEISLHAPA